MDSLLAKANAIDGQKRRRTGSKPSSSHAPSKDSSSSGPLSGFDKTSASIAHHTALPKSLRDGDTLPEHKPEYGHIANKKLRATLNRQSAQSARAKALVEDAELLRTQEGGMMQVEDEMERTWRITQSEVGEGAGSEAGKGRKEYRLDGGPYRCRYTRNGRWVKASLYLCMLSDDFEGIWQ
jgi:U3 small nucleolar RNA-associated protein 7